MRTLLALAGLAAAATVASMSPASAYVVAPRAEAPWCAVIDLGTGDMHWDCSFASVQACRPHVIAGNRGFCNPNPAYEGPVVYQRHGRRHVRSY